MTLFRDPEVSYGGMQVGGIRISHMSHIDADFSIPLTMTRLKRALYKVWRLVITAPAEPPDDAPPLEARAPAPPTPPAQPVRRRVAPTNPDHTL
jgi:hypothetical protein